MTTTSPIDLALKAVSKLFSDTPPDLAAYTDDSSTKLETLVGELSTTGKPHPVLIRMETKEAKKRQPYADLLQQTLKDKNLGVYGSIHSIVAALVESMPASKTKTKRLPNFTKFDDLKAGDVEIYVGADSDKTAATKSRQEATQSLLNWAQLESCLDAPTTSFSRLAGGIRPLVYVFDDYNNFIVNLQEEFYRSQTPKESKRAEAIKEEKIITKNIETFYKRSSSSNALSLESAIRGFGRCLNTLSLVFDIQAPDIKFHGDRTNRYEIVAEKLDFQRLDPERNQIGAFIIDLEWLPEPDWIEKNPDDTEWGKRQPEEMGHIAIRLLTQRYPEIPCFVFTGLWSIEILQKSLAAGAAWCFQKPASHHIGSNNNPNYQPEEELNSFNLERHLTEFAQRNYGSYNCLPNPKQFNTTQDSQLTEKLQLAIKAKEMEIDFYNDECINNQNFRGLVAKQFTAEEVLPVKLLTGGLSGAIATFFAKGVDRDKTSATRFMKIDSWLDIQKEYFSYQHIIRPALNNHVAHIIQPPSVTPPRIKGKAYPLYGAILSSLAGFPEDYTKLRSFEELIDEYLYEKGSENILLNKLKSTLEYLLFPIYQSSRTRLFHSAEHLLPSYTGNLMSINIVKNGINPTPVDTRFGGRIGDHLGKRIKLKGCYLDRVRFKESSLSIKDSVSGATVELLFDSLGKDKLESRFGSLWARLGMNIDIIVDIHSENEVVKKYRQEIEKTIGSLSISSLLDEWKNVVNIAEVKDPFDIVKYGFEFEGLSGTIHGDLNLNNILCPDGEQVGFLIDFPKARKDGLIAFDLAWLEVRIWRYYLIPNIISLAALFKNTGKIARKMLCSALKSSDFVGDSSKLFNSLAKYDEEYGHIDSELLAPISNSLKIISTIREFARKLLINTKDKQLQYALGVSFLNNCKYTVKAKNYFDDPGEINVLSYLASSYYLSGLIQDAQSSERVEASE
jgi:Ternary complex associated domain 9